MKENLTNWATAGDADAMFKLAEILTAEGEIQAAAAWYEKAAELNYLPAVLKAAEISRSQKNFPQALKLYKAATLRDNVTAMAAIVEMFEAGEISGAENLNFLLEIIKSNNCNDIYSRRNPFTMMFLFEFVRGNGYTPEYYNALERRRIANKISKLLGGIQND